MTPSQFCDALVEKLNAAPNSQLSVQVKLAVELDKFKRLDDYEVKELDCRDDDAMEVCVSYLLLYCAFLLLPLLTDDSVSLEFLFPNLFFFVANFVYIAHVACCFFFLCFHVFFYDSLSAENVRLTSRYNHRLMPGSIGHLGYGDDAIMTGLHRKFPQP